jgi:hypothetical protein
MTRRPFLRRPSTRPLAWRVRALVLAVAAIAAFSLVAAGGSAAPSTSSPAAATASQVFPPSANMFGKSYAEWSAAWWQFTLAIPTDDPGPRCRPSENKHVSFLLGIFSPTGQIDCTLPKGASLFLPVLNVDCSSVEAPPFFGATEAAQRACAKALMDQTTEIAASVDTNPVANILRFRVASPQFSFGPLPFPNGLGVPARSSGTAVADGVYLMIKPMRVGEHTVVIHGTFPQFDPPFTIATTIHVTVLPS